MAWTVTRTTDGGDDEPSLAAPENAAGSQVVYMRGSDRDGEAEAPEPVLPEVATILAIEAEILPWNGRGNVIAAAGVALVDLLERARYPVSACHAAGDRIS